MTRHSKNNTAHTVYTYHERQKDNQRSGYGTQEIRLGKDSIRGLECCCLTLQPAQDPVVTPDGFLYDRAVILEYIVNRKADIERRLRLYEKQKSREAQAATMHAKAVKDEEARRFLSLNTLDTHAKASAQAAEVEALATVSNRGSKSSFWISPDSNEMNKKADELVKPDSTVRCPMSGKPLRYKDLTSVKFACFKDDSVVMGTNSGKSSTSTEVGYCCAVSKDPLTNATPCVVLKTSGVVTTKEIYLNIIKKDMVDPISGKKMSNADVIELQRGSLGFADERQNLIAKRQRPSMQT